MSIAVGISPVRTIRVRFSRLLEITGTADKSANLLLRHLCKCGLNLAFAAGAKDKHRLPDRSNSRFRNFRFGITVWMVWIHQETARN
jgi:hypothetical protein